MVSFSHKSNQIGGTSLSSPESNPHWPIRRVCAERARPRVGMLVVSGVSVGVPLSFPLLARLFLSRYSWFATTILVTMSSRAVVAIVGVDV